MSKAKLKEELFDTIDLEKGERNRELQRNIVKVLS